MVAAVGRKIAKEHRARQIPHGKQTVKQLMRHGVSTNSLELSGDTKSFDRVARGMWIMPFTRQARTNTCCFSRRDRLMP